MQSARQADEAKVLPRLAPLAYDHRMSEAERVENLRTLAEFDRLEQSVTIASGWLNERREECLRRSLR